MGLIDSPNIERGNLMTVRHPSLGRKHLWVGKTEIGIVDRVMEEAKSPGPLLRGRGYLCVSESPWKWFSSSFVGMRFV